MEIFIKFHDDSSLRCVWMDIMMPKDAINVTIDVPP